MKSKRILAVVLALVLVLGTAAGAAATQKTITVDGGMKLRINGEEKTPVDVNGKEVDVFAHEGTTYVPLRFIAEALGMKVDYEPATLTAVVESGAAGALTGTGKGFGGDVTATLTMDGGKIVDVVLEAPGETPAIGGAALDELKERILAAQSADIDVVSGATFTSTAVKDAVNDALAKAVEQAGSGDMDAWALANGYVKAADYGIATGIDAITGATETGVGGVNFGPIDWSEELKVMGIKEFLKGGKYLGSQDFAQDDSGYNYREMYQMATSFNNKPTNTNLELVLDAKTLHLVGVSEANTGKTLQFADNPNVSICWCKQLRLENEEDGYNYYCSYGVQFNGTVKVYSVADMETEEGQAAIVNLLDVYYPTLASTWGGYAKVIADKEGEELRQAKIAYGTQLLAAGSMVVYEIIPERIVITAPFLLNMAPAMANATRFATVQEGEDKYGYTLDISDSFIDALIAYKNEVLATESGKAQVEGYYNAVPMLTPSLPYALDPDSAAGMKTQTTWVPAR